MLPLRSVAVSAKLCSSSRRAAVAALSPAAASVRTRADVFISASVFVGGIRHFSSNMGGFGSSSSSGYSSNSSIGGFGSTSMPIGGFENSYVCGGTHHESFRESQMSSCPIASANGEVDAESARQMELITARNMFRAEEDNKYLSSQDVAFEELYALLGSGRTRCATGCAAEILVVDVRSEEEVKATGMIPTACSIPSYVEL